MTPDAIELLTALSIVADVPPPRLRLATAGLIACAVTQSTPATTCDTRPLPEQSSTRTETTLTFLASP